MVRWSYFPSTTRRVTRDAHPMKGNINIVHLAKIKTTTKKLKKIPKNPKQKRKKEKNIKQIKTNKTTQQKTEQMSQTNEYIP
jgi:HPt (histidine-containing phosphotransfer) domain-containing protein